MSELDLFSPYANVTQLPQRMQTKIHMEICTVPGLSPFCWVWTGARNDRRGGYGYAHHEGKFWRVHRLTYTLLIGEIPDGLELDHRCKVRACCHPGHVEPVTHSVNLARGENGWRKPECKYGHPLVGHNLFERKRGHLTIWECRTCINAHARRRRAARQAVAA